MHEHTLLGLVLKKYAFWFNQKNFYSVNAFKSNQSAYLHYKLNTYCSYGFGRATRRVEATVAKIDSE